MNTDIILILLERSDVARFLGMSSTTVIYHVKKRNLVAFAMTPRGSRLFHMDDVQEFKDLRQKEKEERDARKHVSPVT